MKKSLLAILAILTLGFAGVGIAYAANVSDAVYSGIIRITNNSSTAAANVAVPFTANTTIFIDAGYMNDSANNTAVLSTSGADVFYMPAINGSINWVVFVPSIGANSILSDILYMGGPTDMAGTISYFPGTGGMVVADSPTMEPSGNFTYSITGFFDSTVAGEIINKGGDLIVSGDGSGNMIASIANLDLEGIAGVNGAATHWQAVSDSDNATYVFTSNTTFETDIYHIPATTPTAATITNVTYNMLIQNTVIDVAYMQPVFVISGTTYNGTEQSSGSGSVVLLTEVFANSPATASAWTFAEINDMQLGVSLRHGTGAGESRATKVWIVLNLSAGDPITIDPNGPGTTSATATGVASDDYKIDISANVSSLGIFLNDVLEATTLISSGIPDNSGNTTFFTDNVMTHIQTANVSINGTLAGSWEWENGTTFTDLSGNGNDATPTFRTVSSDADVSAELVDFSPLTQAQAPAFTVNITTTGWITENLTTTGNFTSNVSISTYPGSLVIEEVATAGEVPASVLTIILAGVGLLMMSLFVSWVMRRNQENSLLVKLIAVTAFMGVLIATAVIDIWVMYLYAMISFAIIMASSSRSFVGTGNTGNNMFGFAAMSFVGMSLVNRILEGRFLQTTDIDTVRNMVAFQPFEVFGLFQIPVPNVSFLTQGIPALIRWDYSFFGGNAQIVTYLLYSVTAVVSFMLFVLVFGAVYQMFSRGR